MEALVAVASAVDEIPVATGNLSAFHKDTRWIFSGGCFCFLAKLRFSGYTSDMNISERRGFSTVWLVAVLLALAIGASFFVANRKTDVADYRDESADRLTSVTPPAPLVDGQSPVNGLASVYKGEVLAGSVAPLLAFNKADYDLAVASGKLIVLYFYANWCPLCKAEFPIMQEVFNALTNDRVVGFRVNYNDSETDADEKVLAKEFGVAYQHTKVLAQNGKRVLKSPESWNRDRYIKEINR